MSDEWCGSDMCWCDQPEDIATEVSLEDTGRRPCTECRRVTGHKIDCSKGSKG